MEDTLLTLYLSLFFVGWKKGHKVYWIHHELRYSLSEMDEDGKEIKRDGLEIFKRHAIENKFPLFVQDEYYGSCPYLLATVNKRFSDWVHAKNPTAEKFIENVIKNRETLMVTSEKVATEHLKASRDIPVRRREALDSFGGEVVSLAAKQLTYQNMGRTTGGNVGMEIKTSRRR